MRQPRKILSILLAVLLAVVGLSACEGEEQGSSAKGQKQTETAFAQQENAVPYPVEKLTDSTERRNLRERLLRTNDPNRQGYVYLMNFGQIVGYYAIKGKVSSTQSAMTPTDIIRDPCASSFCPLVVQAPGDDGSYGDNEPGIFFFTTDGVMVSTSLDYIESDNPLPIDVPRLNSK